MCCETPLPHSLHCSSNSFISTCPIHHYRHPNIVIHSLPSFHPLIVMCNGRDAWFTDISGVHLSGSLPILSLLLFARSLDCLEKVEMRKTSCTFSVRWPWRVLARKSVLSHRRFHSPVLRDRPAEAPWIALHLHYTRWCAEGYSSIIKQLDRTSPQIRSI